MKVKAGRQVFIGRNLLSALLLVFAILFATDVVAKQQVKVAFEHYPPWMIAKGGEKRGFDCEFINKLLGHMGLEAVYVPIAFNGALQGLKDGSIDLACGLYFRDERNQYIRFVSPPYRTKVTICFYMRKDSGLIIDKYIDIAGLKVGVDKGVKYFPTFDLDDRMLKVEYSSQVKAFEALARREVDLVVCSASVGRHYIEEMGYRNVIAECGFRYQPKLMPIYLGVSRKSFLQSRVEEMSAVIRYLDESGVLQSLAEKYFVKVN